MSEGRRVVGTGKLFRRSKTPFAAVHVGDRRKGGRPLPKIATYWVPAKAAPTVIAPIDPLGPAPARPMSKETRKGFEDLLANLDSKK